MVEDLLQAEREHLARLLEAIQRCVYFLHASDRKIAWPLTAEALAENRKNEGLFESMAAINERFAKLQDTLGAAMRHATLLMGEPAESFLKVLAFQEKTGVIDSIESWQLCRTARNLAAHDYETEYTRIAEHFNALHELQPVLYLASSRFLERCAEDLEVHPASDDFAREFAAILGGAHDAT